MMAIGSLGVHADKYQLALIQSTYIAGLIS